MLLLGYRTAELILIDRLLEPVIGNICACLPSVNILLETLTAKKEPANMPRSRLLVKWLRHSFRSVTASSLSFDFWSKSNLGSKPGRDEKSFRTQQDTSTRKDEVDPPRNECHIDVPILSLPHPTTYPLPPLSFTACGFAELGQARSIRTSMTKEEIRAFEKREHDEDDVAPQNGNRKAKSWDGVILDTVEDWNPAGLGTLESLHNQTTVRIKWLGSASH